MKSDPVPTIHDPTRWKFAQLILVLLLLFGMTSAMSFLESEYGRKLTMRQQIIQYYAPQDVNPLDDYGQVFTVSHNSGESLRTIRVALNHGATAIEIDVASLNGRLIASHESPSGAIQRSSFRGLSLNDAWRASAPADVIQLDLKENSPQFLSSLFAFLDRNPTTQQVIVSSRSVTTLQAFEQRAPSVHRFLSINTQMQLDVVLSNRGTLELIDGVTLRQSLITADVTAQLIEQNVIIIAWTVNDLRRVNELVPLGVTGFTTENLAIVDILGRIPSTFWQIQQLPLVDPDPEDASGD